MIRRWIFLEIGLSGPLSHPSSNKISYSPLNGVHFKNINLILTIELFYSNIYLLVWPSLFTPLDLPERISNHGSLKGGHYVVQKNYPQQLWNNMIVDLM